MMKTVGLLCMVLAAVDGKGVSFSRSVSKVMSGAYANVTLSPGCTSHDSYGSKACSWSWGDKVTLSVDGTLPEAITTGATFKVASKIDGIEKLDFTCPLCGGECEFEIPVAKKKVKQQMPPCPLIGAGHVMNSTVFQLPTKSPSPISATIKGTVTVYDSKAATMAEVTFDAHIDG